MGADMFIASLVIDEGREPDIAAAHRAVNAIAAADVIDRNELLELPDPNTREGPNALQEDLHRCLQELEQALGGREFTRTTVARRRGLRHRWPQLGGIIAST
jgi:hypothetical protein